MKEIQRALVTVKVQLFQFDPLDPLNGGERFLIRDIAMTGLSQSGDKHLGLE